MGDFNNYKKYLLDGNLDGIKHRWESEFKDQVIDEESQKRPIHFACRYGHLEIVKWLIDSNCDVESKTLPDYWRPIHFACRYGQVEIVRWLLDRPCKIESRTAPDSWRPIHIACCYGYIAIVKLLLEYKCKVESETLDKWRPIHLACHYGHVEVAKLLINYKCNIECESQTDKWKPIHFASRYGHYGVAQLLINNQCDIEVETKSERLRPIHSACAFGHLDMVQLLIDNKCSLECETIENWRPIHYTCMVGQLSTLKVLVKNNCEIHCRTIIGKTPLSIAKKYRNLDCARFLMNIAKSKKLFATVRANDVVEFDKLYNSQTLAMVEFETELSVLECAIKHYADKIIRYITDKNISEEVPYFKEAVKDEKLTISSRLMQECLLYRCIRDHHAEGFHFLNSADLVNGTRQMVPCSFLEVAAEHGSCAFISELLKKTIYDREVWLSAKNKAAQYGHHRIVTAIWNRETIINSRTDANFTILHTAVCDNDVDVLKYLLENRLFSQDFDQEIIKSSLALAHYLFHEECVKILKEYDSSDEIIDQYLDHTYSRLDPHVSVAVNLQKSEKPNYEDDVDGKDKLEKVCFNPLFCAILKGSPKMCAQLVEEGANCIQYTKFPRPPSEGLTESMGTIIKGYEKHSQKIYELNNSANFDTISRSSSYDAGSQNPRLLKTALPFTIYENAITLCMKVHGMIYPCFMNLLNEKTVNMTDDEGNTLLHMAAQSLQPDWCRIFIKEGAIVDTKNKLGNTALLKLICNLDEQKVACNYHDIMSIVTMFIEAGCNINSKTNTGMTIFQCASKLYIKRLMFGLLLKYPNLPNISEDDFNFAYNKNWIRYGKTVIPPTSKNVLSSSATIKIIHLCMIFTETTLIKSLFNNSNQDVQQSVVEDLIYNAFLIEDDSFFDYLINREILEAKLLDNGETVLTNLIRQTQTKYCLKLLRSECKMAYINFKNKRKQTPLQVAIETEAVDIIRELISMADILSDEDEEDLNQALNDLFKKISNSRDIQMKEKLKDVMKTLIPKETIKDLSRLRVSSNQEVKICNICLKKQVEKLFSCGHNFCSICASDHENCPVCKFRYEDKLEF